MKRTLTIIFLVGIVYLLFPAPKANSMDPVSMAVLAPVAIEVAKVAMPYVLRYLGGMATVLVDMGIDVLNIFRLPIGFFETTFLAPWYFSDGVLDLLKGAIAPLKLCFHALILPIKPLGRL